MLSKSAYEQCMMLKWEFIWEISNLLSSYFISLVCCYSAHMLIATKMGYNYFYDYSFVTALLWEYSTHSFYCPWIFIYCAIVKMIKHFDGLVQERHNSIANALELCLSCSNPSNCFQNNNIYMDAYAIIVPLLQTIFLISCLVHP